MSYSCFLYVALLLHNGPLRPEVGRLQSSFRKVPGTTEGSRPNEAKERTPGFLLEESLNLGRWVVCSLYGFEDEALSKQGARSNEKIENVNKKIRPAIPGLIAIDLKTGRTLQLTAQGGQLKADGKMNGLRTIDGIDYLFRDRQGNCGVVLARYMVDADGAGKCVESDLWIWDLDHGSLKLAGRWNAARMLAAVLDVALVDVGGRGIDKSESELVELRDKQTDNRTECVLNNASILEDFGARALFAGREIIIPVADGCSFVILTSERINSAQFRFECVDPRSPGGRRWKLDASDLQKITGFPVAEIWPVPGIAPKVDEVAFCVTGSGTPLGQHHQLVLLDAKTGLEKRRISLKWYPEQMVMAPDGASALVLVKDDPDAQQKARITRFLMVDCKSGSICEYVDFDRSFDVFLFSFDGRRIVLGQSPTSIWRFILEKKSLKTERLFQLDPSIQK